MSLEIRLKRPDKVYYEGVQRCGSAILTSTHSLSSVCPSRSLSHPHTRSPGIGSHQWSGGGDQYGWYCPSGYQIEPWGKNPFFFSLCLSFSCKPWQREACAALSSFERLLRVCMGVCYAWNCSAGMPHWARMRPNRVAFQLASLLGHLQGTSGGVSVHRMVLFQVHVEYVVAKRDGGEGIRVECSTHWCNVTTHTNTHTHTHTHRALWTCNCPPRVWGCLKRSTTASSLFSSWATVPTSPVPVDCPVKIKN